MLPPQTCIMFDLDGTLAPSKNAMTPKMASLFSELLKVRKLAVVSGGAMEQFEKQFLANFDITAATMENLFLLPTSGAAMYRWDSGWKEVYREILSSEEVEKIKQTINEVIDQSGLEDPTTLYGERVENRGTQITFSWFGQQTPIEIKRSWDPDYQKRKHLVSLLTPKLPEFSIGMGGMTSIDITKKGIDKAYGINKTVALLGIGLPDILYVGDAIFEGGNDYAAVTDGVATQKVSGPEDTEKLIEGWLQP